MSVQVTKQIMDHLQQLFLSQFYSKVLCLENTLNWKTLKKTETGDKH